MTPDFGRELYGLKPATNRLPAPTAPSMKAAHPCPTCVSSAVHRDLPRSRFERWILPLFERRPYRCVDCGHRFYDRPRAVRASISLKRGASPRLPEWHQA